MTQVQLLSTLNQLQEILDKAKDVLETTYMPAFVILYYIKEETGIDISQIKIKVD